MCFVVYMVSNIYLIYLIHFINIVTFNNHIITHRTRQTIKLKQSITHVYDYSLFNYPMNLTKTFPIFVMLADSCNTLTLIKFNYFSTLSILCFFLLIPPKHFFILSPFSNYTH